VNLPVYILVKVALNAVLQYNPEQKHEIANSSSTSHDTTSTKPIMSTTTPIKLLLTGLIPSSDNVPQYFRDLYGTASEIEAKIQADIVKIKSAGYDVTLYYMDDSDPEAGLKWLEDKLHAEKFDGITIGSGLRLVPPQTELFESVVDVCRRLAQDSVYMFNYGPGTNYEAVERNLGRLRAAKGE
jgi:hypothetical protein